MGHSHRAIEALFCAKMAHFYADMNHVIRHCDADAGVGLDALPQGVPAIVERITADVYAEHAVGLRLMEIGFLPGEQVCVIAKGFPANDPLAVHVGQATFALRRYEAALVQVQPVARGVA